MKNIGISLIILALVSVVFASQFSVLPVKAVAARVPGVRAGDWARYDVTFNFTTNDPKPPVTPPPPEISDLEYYGIDVLSVVNSNITFRMTTRFKNGTESSYSMWADVSSGTPMGFPYLFIAANLSAGDALFSFPTSPTINATLLRSYAGLEREVNLLHLVQNITGSFGYLATGKIRMYWDRASGIVDELVYEINYTKFPEGYVTYALIRLVIKATNIWSPAYVSAEVVISPKCLNLRSRGRWITVFIGLPEGYNVRKVDVSSIMLNDSLRAEKVVALLDCDGDRRLELMVKFDRQAVIDLILKASLRASRCVRGFGVVTLSVTGKLKDGTAFQGSDNVMVIYKIPRIRIFTEWEDLLYYYN